MDFTSGDYSLGRELGRGGGGILRAIVHNPREKAIAACKSLAKKDSPTLQTELSVMQRIGSHPSVVQCLNTAEDECSIHLIMELCPYGDLFHYLLRKGKLEEGPAARILIQLLFGIHHFHERGIVHRDIKPENILIKSFSRSISNSELLHSDPIVKIADFGLATNLKVNQTLNSFCGSPLYMAPEILRTHPYGSKVDIWSVGVIVYTALCGFMPFTGQNEIEYMENVASGVPVDLRAHPWPQVSALAKDLDQKMLHPDPVKRISAMEALNHPWIRKHAKRSQRWHRHRSCSGPTVNQLQHKVRRKNGVEISENAFNGNEVTISETSI
eukprot:TRINITY_DN5216_c0_g1_i1.p1 TRINITY_DN5216_c0_g1~~TRINITY_DN5216_c0_g1_i1.p1  ORF type:complete len:343 (-),score=7.90 TRINITY_DN5216_c0_g1_i1:179-1159(-)